jgi:hypothetical protein
MGERPTAWSGAEKHSIVRVAKNAVTKVQYRQLGNL